MDLIGYVQSISGSCSLFVFEQTTIFCTKKASKNAIQYVVRPPATPHLHPLVDQLSPLYLNMWRYEIWIQGPARLISLSKKKWRCVILISVNSAKVSKSYLNPPPSTHPLTLLSQQRQAVYNTRCHLKRDNDLLSRTQHEQGVSVLMTSTINLPPGWAKLVEIEWLHTSNMCSK